MRMRLAALALGSLLLPASAGALTVAPADFTCPIDGKPFTVSVMTSGTSYGSYFDGQLVGPIESPVPLVACPGNGFIIDRDGAYTDAELAKLRPFVTSAQYKHWLKDDSAYYRLAKQREFMGDTPDSIADALLQATWEAGGDLYQRYAGEALDALRKLAAREASQGEDAIGTRMLAGELERRLGRFDEARATFTALQADPAFPGKGSEEARSYRRKVAEAQLQLIAARDTGRARLDDDGKLARF